MQSSEVFCGIGMISVMRRTEDMKLDMPRDMAVLVMHLKFKFQRKVSAVAIKEETCLLRAKINQNKVGDRRSGTERI